MIKWLKPKLTLWQSFEFPKPFFYACSAYYDDRFDYCLKQVRVVYPDLDLSQIIIDDIVSPTPSGEDAISNDTDDSVHIIEQEVKDTDGMAVA